MSALLTRWCGAGTIIGMETHTETPTTDPTPAQLDYVDDLLARVPYPRMRAELKDVWFPLETKGKASELIDYLLTVVPATAKRPTGSPAKTKQAAKAKRTTGSGPTTKQINYAMRLIRRGGWYDSYHGQFNPQPPTEADLRSMTRREVSEIIDDLAS